MASSNRYSSVITITFAEFAWLAFFGILFINASTMNENEVMSKELEHFAEIEKSFQKTLQSKEKLQDIIRSIQADYEALSEVQDSKADPDKSKEELDSIKTRLNRTNESIIALELKNNELTQKLITAKETSRDLTDERDKNKVLQDKLVNLQTNNETESDLRVEIEGIRESNRTIQKELNAVITELAEKNSEIEKLSSERQKHISQSKSESSVRQELLGIKVENLDRVVFVMDCSSSMTQNNAENWRSVLKILEDWTYFLPFNNLSLISFNRKATVYPKKNNDTNVYFSIRDEDGDIDDGKRLSLLNYVSELRTAPGTNTLAALKEASEFKDADLVVLFTDGAPESGVFSTTKKLQNEILSFAKSYIDVPIFVVALGDHDSRNLKFLKDLSKTIPNGGFIAR